MKDVLIRNYESVRRNVASKLPHVFENIDGWFCESDQRLFADIVRNAKNDSHFVEIGAWMGRSTSFMAIEIKNSKKNIKFDTIDTFKGSPSEQIHLNIAKEYGGNVYNKFIENMTKYNLLNAVNPIIGDSVEVSNKYEDGSLDFIFIDGDHLYESVKQDIMAWLPKLKPDGIMAGDDYNVFDGVTNAVNELLGSQIVIDKYTWMRKVSKETINVHFVEQPFVEILGEKNNHKYKIEFWDEDSGNSVFSYETSVNHWVRANRRWFTNYTVNIYRDSVLFHVHHYNAKNKRVYVHIDSKSLGDNLAWFPYVEEFRRKHGCKMICSTFWNELFQKNYPEIEFVTPGAAVDGLYAMYTIGIFIGNYDKNKKDYRIIPLQQVASDMLGIPFYEIRPRISFSKYVAKEKFVSMSKHSTAQAKYWNNLNGWKEVAAYLQKKNLKMISVAKEGCDVDGVKVIQNDSILVIAGIIMASEFFIGLPSGLAWLAWALGKKVVMISGFSQPWYEFTGNNYYVHNPHVCNGCFVDPELEFDKGDWNWCPRLKGTSRQFECSKTITSEMAIEKINEILDEEKKL